ncbi:MAG: radical SAM protein [Desulfobacca sp.]|uniref:radical SAM protein n=1 Tax=Desulfobacca sp. TaxID=2067990 RepID=UPI00404A1747
MSLRVCETFVSILGESSFVGLPAFFIRLSGCNLRCRYCDTTYAYSDGQPVTVAGLVAAAQASGQRYTLVTGGEPLLQEECPDLLRALADAGITVLLETNGSRPVQGLDPRVHRIVDLKCPSSGMAAHNYLKNLDELTARDELKCVVQDRQDFDWALATLRPWQSWERHQVLFAPVFGALPPAELAAWLLATRLPLRLNLQIHKYIWHPEARGV